MGSIALSHVTIHGHDVRYRRAGNRRRQRILLLHGLAGSSRTWQHVMPGLAERYDVIAPDLLGHGESAKPMGDYSLGAMASGLRDLLAMLYLGGLSSISGSILGTVLIQFLSEILRPLELAKWMVIPVILILVMVRRPRGLLGFREVTFSFLSTVKEEVEDASAGN